MVAVLVTKVASKLMKKSSNQSQNSQDIFNSIPHTNNRSAAE